jgi:hypothetical protein
MSDTDSYKSAPLDDSSEYGSEYGQFVNERGDRHSEESSGYHISAKIDPTSKNKKYVRRNNPDTKQNLRVEFFPTKTYPNSGIKHAITGTYQYANGRLLRTGTKDEYLFFSVILATGELGPNAPVLFYDSPEQYERHFITKLPSEFKEGWNQRRNAALFDLKAQAKRDEKEANGGVVFVK